MKKISYIPLLLLCLISIINSSCEKKETDSNFDDVNSWIDYTMRQQYLWNNDIPEAQYLNYQASPEAFFQSLLSKKDGKDRGGQHYYFSRIEKRNDTKTRAIADANNTYGYEYALYLVSNSSDGSLLPTPIYYARILYVLPGSPAAEAGIHRDDWIVEIDGKEVTASGTSKFASGSKATFGLAKFKLYNGKWTLMENGETKIEASRAVEDNPILVDTVYHTNGKHIGYLKYNHFTSGPSGYSDHAYEDQMKEIFADFKTNNVNEFILDLRYNGGGYVTTSQILASMLVPEKNQNDIYCKEKDNKESIKDIKFLNTVPNLGLQRIFVLVNENTASASEALINGLRPFMEVTLIGEQTLGKNVGATLTESKKLGWDLWPITFYVYNSKMESDYENGFTPQYIIDEFDTSIYPILYPLGNMHEAMLNKALQLMGINTLKSDMQSSPVQSEGLKLIWTSIKERGLYSVE